MGDCWHFCLELHSSNPFDRSSSYNNNHCGSNCPCCDGSMKKLVKTISRKGIEMFLSEIFIENNYGSLTPVQLVKKLYEYPQAGKLVHCRQTALEPEKALLLCNLHHLLVLLYLPHYHC